MTMSRMREMVDEFDLTSRLMRRVRRYMRKQPELAVFAVTLTYPPRSMRMDWLYKSIHWLIDRLEDSECLLLVVDMGKKGWHRHPHWHGILMARRSQAHFAKLWASKTGASIRGIRIGYVRGQDGDRSSVNFKKQLGDWLRYCWKRSANVDLTLRERVVASGALEEQWRSVFEGHSNGPYTIIEVKDGVIRLASGAVKAGTDEAADGRPCRGCEKPLPPDLPSNKWHHGEACRSLARKKRETAKRGRSQVAETHERSGAIVPLKRGGMRDDVESKEGSDSREEYRKRGDP